MANTPSQKAGSKITLEEYEKIFKAYYSELCSYAAKIINDPLQAEEIVQELFTNLWSKREVLRIQKDTKSYLMHAVKNNCMMYFRDKRPNQFTDLEEIAQSLDDRSQVIQQLTAQEISQIMNNTLQNVPERWRNIFTMIRFEGYKYREVAEKLSISVKTVEKAMGQMLKMFRHNLVEYLSILLIIMEIWQQ